MMVLKHSCCVLPVINFFEYYHVIANGRVIGLVGSLPLASAALIRCMKQSRSRVQRGFPGARSVWLLTSPLETTDCTHFCFCTFELTDLYEKHCATVL